MPGLVTGKQGGKPESYLGHLGLGGSLQSAISRNTEGSWISDPCWFRENRTQGELTLYRPSQASKSFNSQGFNFQGFTYLIKQSNK